MYRNIGKILAIILVLVLVTMIFLFIASTKSGDDGTVQNKGVTTR